jgi:hypothetical protein
MHFFDLMKCGDSFAVAKNNSSPAGARWAALF